MPQPQSNNKKTKTNRERDLPDLPADSLGGPPLKANKTSAIRPDAAFTAVQLKAIQDLIEALEVSPRLPPDLVAKLAGTPFEPISKSLQRTALRLFKAESAIDGVFYSGGTVLPVALPKELCRLVEQQDDAMKRLGHVSQGINDIAVTSQSKLESVEKSLKEHATQESDRAKKSLGVVKTDLALLAATVVNGTTDLQAAIGGLTRRKSKKDKDTIVALQQDVDSLKNHNSVLEFNLSEVRKQMSGLDRMLNAVVDGDFLRAVTPSDDVGEAEDHRSDIDLSRSLHASVFQIVAQSQGIADVATHASEWVVEEDRISRSPKRINQWSEMTRHVKTLETQLIRMLAQRDLMDDQRKSLHFAIMQLQAGIPVEKWAKSVPNARDQEPSGQLRDIWNCLTTVAEETRKLRKKNDRFVVYGVRLNHAESFRSSFPSDLALPVVLIAVGDLMGGVEPSPYDRSMLVSHS